MKNPILPSVAGLLVALAVGMTAAAASASAASENTPMVKVRIHLKGWAVPVYRPEFRGRFTLSGTTHTRVGARFIRSGTISDRGTFVHRGLLNFPPPYVRTLRGAKGTIWVRGVKRRWRITNATGVYAGLRGQGQDRGVPGANGVDVTMTGTLVRPHIG